MRVIQEITVAKETPGCPDPLGSAVLRVKRVGKGTRVWPRRKDILEIQGTMGETGSRERRALRAVTVCLVSRGTEVFQETAPEEKRETKVHRVGPVDPGHPGSVGQTVLSSEATKVTVGYLVTTASPAIMAFRGHLAGQARAMWFRDLLGHLDFQDPVDFQVTQVLRVQRD